MHKRNSSLVNSSPAQLRKMIGRKGNHLKPSWQKKQLLKIGGGRGRKMKKSLSQSPISKSPTHLIISCATWDCMMKWTRPLHQLLGSSSSRQLRNFQCILLWNTKRVGYGRPSPTPVTTTFVSRPLSPSWRWEWEHHTVVFWEGKQSYNYQKIYSEMFLVLTYKNFHVIFYLALITYITDYTGYSFNAICNPLSKILILYHLGNRNKARKLVQYPQTCSVLCRLQLLTPRASI